MNMPDHHQQVCGPRAGQSIATVDIAQVWAYQHDIDWMLDKVPLQPQGRIIDMACGTGTLARALARHGAHVTAVDVSAAQLHQARALAEAQGLDTIRFQEIRAGSRALANDAFDMAIARFSLHHFSDTALTLSEMMRLVHAQGHVVIIDVLAPGDTQLAERYNYYERLRDARHVRALTFDQLHNAICDTGLEILHTDLRDIDCAVLPWLALTRTAADKVQAIVGELEEEIAGQRPASGLFPFHDADGVLMLRQSWALVLACKP